MVTLEKNYLKFCKNWVFIALTGGIKKGVIFLSNTSWTWNFAIADNVRSSCTDVIRRPGSTASNWNKIFYLVLDYM